MKTEEFIESQKNKIVNNSRLTISGEINIMTDDIKEAILLKDELYGKVCIYADSLSKVLPFIEVETVKELHEITIKLFSKDKSFNDDKFLDNLQQQLEILLENIYKNNGLSVKVNIFGEIKTWEKVDKFRVVNDKKDVYSKIIETVLQNKLSRTIGNFTRKIAGKNKY